MSRSTRRRPPSRRPRRRRQTTPAANLFDVLDSPQEDASLLADLVALVALGLLEERASPDGMVFALTELGEQTPESDLEYAAHYDRGMCRNIRQLHNFAPPATSEEMHDAALQYVRKISGSTKPSQANAAAFDRAVAAVAAATQELLAELITNAPPKNREEEAARSVWPMPGSQSPLS